MLGLTRVADRGNLFPPLRRSLNIKRQDEPVSSGNSARDRQLSMKTFNVQTLGCKVNFYESQQLAALLRERGLIETDASQADLRIVNSCSVTMQAASQSRQAARRMVRLPLLPVAPSPSAEDLKSPPRAAVPLSAGKQAPPRDPSSSMRVIVTGCWATSDSAEAATIAGVDAVITHHQDVAAELDRLLAAWKSQESPFARAVNSFPEQKPVVGDDVCGWSNNSEASSASPAVHSKSLQAASVNENATNPAVGGVTIHRGAGFQPAPKEAGRKPAPQIGSDSPLIAVTPAVGTRRLPLLGEHQTGRQRAVMKIQDGCDASCTYCIIPRLRPAPWSKSTEDAVNEASALVAAGHVEIVLTGIFLGAYGHPTALRRRQLPSASEPPLARLIDALCTRVDGLRRLRLSSLEPGDMTDDLIAVLRAHHQIIPHFHLPLQSGSDAILRRMNRQYRSDDLRRMIDRVRSAFDRPALTTDVIVGFPGEGEEEFAQTLQLVREAGFIHVHGFPFSPRPGTAAARWHEQFLPGAIANERVAVLNDLAAKNSLGFRRQFIGEIVEVIVESRRAPGSPRRHGRCERYFMVDFESDFAQPGDAVRVVISEVREQDTLGRPV
jgi:MiaB/RimO family radical SAM methylthiotransferase